MQNDLINVKEDTVNPLGDYRLRTRSSIVATLSTDFTSFFGTQKSREHFKGHFITPAKCTELTKLSNSPLIFKYEWLHFAIVSILWGYDIFIFSTECVYLPYLTLFSLQYITLGNMFGSSFVIGSAARGAAPAATPLMRGTQKQCTSLELQLIALKLYIYRVRGYEKKNLLNI